MKTIKKTLFILSFLTSSIIKSSGYNIPSNLGQRAQQFKSNVGATAQDVANMATAQTYGQEYQAGKQLYGQMQTNAQTQMGQFAIKAAESPQAKAAAKAAAMALV